MLIGGPPSSLSFVSGNPDVSSTFNAGQRDTRVRARVVAVHPSRHHDVGEQKINWLALEDFEGRVAVFRLKHAIAEIIELAHDDAAQALVVFDRQNGFVAAFLATPPLSRLRPQLTWRAADRAGKSCRGRPRCRH